MNTHTTPAPAAPVLRLRGVAKVREQGDSRFELQVPEFHVRPGEFVALVGESGCGKSTLLDLLALISEPSACDAFGIRPETDEVDVCALWRRRDEKALAGLRKRHLGYVLQTGGLLPYLTVGENLMLPARINGLRGYRADLLELAERMGIARYLDRLPEKLSGGQRQRVAILRALSHRPRLVLADEPTAAVDRARARSIVEDFRRLAGSAGLAIVMVTHDLDLVRPVADRCYGFAVRAESEHRVHAECREVSLHG